MRTLGRLAVLGAVYLGIGGGLLAVSLIPSGITYLLYAWGAFVTISIVVILGVAIWCALLDKPTPWKSEIDTHRY